MQKYALRLRCVNYLALRRILAPRSNMKKKPNTKSCERFGTDTYSNINLDMICPAKLRAERPLALFYIQVHTFAGGSRINHIICSSVLARCKGLREDGKQFGGRWHIDRKRKQSNHAKRGVREASAEHSCMRPVQFSPLCVRLCLVKLPLIEKRRPHSSQANGFSPLCVRLCVFKLPLCEKRRPHSSQANGFSPLCIRLCAVKWRFCTNDSPHSSQDNRATAPCERTCSVSLGIVAKFTPRSSQITDSWPSACASSLASSTPLAASSACWVHEQHCSPLRMQPQQLLGGRPFPVSARLGTSPNASNTALPVGTPQDTLPIEPARDWHPAVSGSGPVRTLGRPPLLPLRTCRALFSVGFG
jgi:hypothetical protein